MNAIKRHLHETAIEPTATFHRTEAELISILQRIEEEKIHIMLGYSSLYAYAVSELKLSESNAYTFMSLARKSRLVPALKEEIQNGSLPVSKARRIVSVITPENHEEWIQKAARLSRVELEKAVQKVNPEVSFKAQVRVISEGRVKLHLPLSDKVMNKLKRAQTIVCQNSRKAANLEETLESVLDLFLFKKDPVVKAERWAARTQDQLVHAPVGEKSL